VVFDFFVGVVEERVPLYGVEGDRVPQIGQRVLRTSRVNNNMILLEGLRESADILVQGKGNCLLYIEFGVRCSSEKVHNILETVPLLQRLDEGGEVVCIGHQFERYCRREIGKTKSRDARTLEDSKEERLECNVVEKRGKRATLS
jgi:hypothetical protein